VNKKPDRATLRRLRNQHYALSREHAEVKARVREYTARRHLSPGEQMECRTLQRMKLQKKDALRKLERRLGEIEAALSPAERLP
jgi:sulfur relay (sulfurtransferase) DsrC/TusE family protein